MFSIHSCSRTKILLQLSSLCDLESGFACVIFYCCCLEYIYLMFECVLQPRRKWQMLNWNEFITDEEVLLNNTILPEYWRPGELNSFTATLAKYIDCHPSRVTEIPSPSDEKGVLLDRMGRPRGRPWMSFAGCLYVFRRNQVVTWEKKFKLLLRR